MGRRRRHDLVSLLIELQSVFLKSIRHILTSVANLTKAQERHNSEINELRKEVDKLRLRLVN